MEYFNWGEAHKFFLPEAHRTEKTRFDYHNAANLSSYF
jgi:hypothetical protein